ncbi:DNA-directed DNA polymerase [Ceratobasidium sp. 394]|nr:DNA-directed DNA polymerase [Ceratobasidium sp. 394]
MSTTLPLFWHLSSATVDERLDASVKLITSLEQFQDNKASTAAAEESEDEEPSEEDSGDEESGTKQDNELNSEDVKYALRRLIRGLASPRESSRLGFSVALTELLTRLNTIDAAGIISSILEASVTSGSMKGQEIRDTLFARLFGLTAVIQSGLLFRSSRLPTSLASPNELGPPASSLSAYQTTVTELVNLGDKKAWLRESAFWAIVLAVKLLYSTSPEVAWKEEAVEWTLETMYTGDRATEWTPDKLVLTLCLQELDPSRPWKDLLAPVFRNPSVLSSSNLPVISRILKEVVDSEEPDVKGAQGGHFKIQIHSVWDAILHAIVDGKSKLSFAEFYKVCVDESLFAPTSSSERKSWGFQVFERALTILPPAEYRYLFTPNFMRSWINHLASPDRLLHKAAKKAASEIVKAVERNPSVGFSLVTHLQGTHGNQQFDRITRTKTVETILASADIEGVKKYTASLITQFRENDANVDPGEQDTKRRYVIEQLSALMRNGSIPKDDEWIISILEFFILHGMFTVTKKNKASALPTLHHVIKPPLSDSLRSTCRVKLLTMLGDLTGQARVVKDESGQTSRVASSTTGGELWVTKALKIVEIFEQDPTHVVSLREVDDTESALRTRARKILKALQRKKDAAEDEASRGAELLISALLFQTYTEEDDSNSDVLESCLDATEKLFNLSKKAKPSSPDDDEHSPIDLLVDTIVGMLEASSGFSRTMATTAFGKLSGRIEESTIDLVLMQLEQRDVNDEDSEDQYEDEGAEAPNGTAEEDGSDSSESSDEEEEEDDSDDDAEVDPEFRRQVAEALQVNGMAPAEDDGDSDDSDSEDEVMLDDEQMMQLDEHLAKVFKSQAGGNTKEKKGAQREATHFKIRILDLLDIFLNKQPQSPFVPRTVLPLVKVILSSGPDECQLSEKTTGILRSRIGKLKDIPTTGFDQASVVEDLQGLHDIARKTTASEVSACSIYLSRVLQGGEQVLDVYRASIDDFTMRKNSKLASAFLKDFVVRQITYAWGLREHVAGKCAPGIAVNVYRQMQMWGLVQSMLSQIGPLMGQPPILDEFFTFIPLIRDALYKTLRSSCQQTEHAPNAAQMKDLLKIGLQALRLTRKFAQANDDLGTCWDTSAFEEVRQALAGSDRFKSSVGVHTLAKQFASLLGATNQPQETNGAKKRKGGEEEAGKFATEHGTHEAEPRKKRKKVKKHRQA